MRVTSMQLLIMGQWIAIGGMDETQMHTALVASPDSPQLRSRGKVRKEAPRIHRQRSAFRCSQLRAHKPNSLR